MSVYTMKELEKLIPSVAGIHAMAVKDYFQAIQDENQIRAEKIGSGNWYWSFRSDAKKMKENLINNLTLEENRLTRSITEAERYIEEEMAKREEDAEMLEEGGMSRKALLKAHETILKEMELLDKELAVYSDNDPTDVLRKAEETEKLKESAIKWTDNIECLEYFIGGLGIDRGQVAILMQNACGDEYVIGEGLKEL